MPRICSLNVSGIIKTGHEIDYEDLKILIKQFIDKNGHFPIQPECTMSNNLPQFRIINKILKSNNITFNDFCNYFGKVKHVRTENGDYDLLLSRYKIKCNEIGRALKINELVLRKLCKTFNSFNRYSETFRLSIIIFTLSM